MCVRRSSTSPPRPRNRPRPTTCPTTTSKTKPPRRWTMPTSKHFTFLPRDFKGSRLRCLLLTHRPNADVATFLTSLTSPAAVVTGSDQWAPRGFLEPDEAKLGETAGFLVDVKRDL